MNSNHNGSEHISNLRAGGHGRRGLSAPVEDRPMNPLNTYAAARHRAGMVDLGARGRIVVRGADRKTFLHALLTNDIALLGPGTGCYAALLTPQGRIIADMNVFELGDAMLVDARREVKDVLLAQIRPADLQRGRPARRRVRRVGLRRAVRAAGGGDCRRRGRGRPCRVRQFPEREVRQRRRARHRGEAGCPGAGRVPPVRPADADLQSGTGDAGCGSSRPAGRRPRRRFASRPASRRSSWTWTKARYRPRPGSMIRPSAT